MPRFPRPTAHPAAPHRPVRLGLTALGLILGAGGDPDPLAGQRAPRATISGVGYVHYRYHLDVDSSFTPPGHRNNFDVDRSYLTLNADLSRGATARITADVDHRAATEQLTFRLKYAWAAWTPRHSPITLKLGLIETPIVGYLEQLWDYRMQGPVAPDRAGIVTSSDFGFSAQGSWNRDAVQAVAGVFNGEGYSRAPGGPGKDVAARISVRLTGADTTSSTSGLRLTGYAHHGRADGGGTRQRWMGMLTWQSRRITLAAAQMVTRDSTALSPRTSGRLLSTWAVYRLAGRGTEVMARYDRHDPDADRDPPGPDLATGVQQRLIAGIAHRLTPNLRALVDADLLSLQHGSPDSAFQARRRSIALQLEFRF